MENQKKFVRAIKIVVFLLIAAVVFCGINYVMLPTRDARNYNSISGIYEEPKNTIETLFVGDSHLFRGFSPMELYGKYGICAYDIASDGQPVGASYYWIKEIYRLDGETLDTVVFDVSALRTDFGTSLYHIATDTMPFSMVKMQVVGSYSENFSDAILNLFPALSYHERWKELTSQDFLKGELEPDTYLRGYSFSTGRWVDSVSDYSEISVPYPVLDESAEGIGLSERTVGYLGKIVSFCNQHDINFLMTAAPSTWSSSTHNAIQKLADEYGVEFIDFNVEPYFSEVGFNYATDLYTPTDLDNLHANYYGAVKLTDYIGAYLVNEYGSKDVRGDEKYAFMEDEYGEYLRRVAPAKTMEYTDPCDYIDYYLNEGDNTILLSVKDEATAALTEEQREYFASIGLTGLSKLTYRASYLAVVEDGRVIKEMSQEDPGSGDETGTVLSYDGSTADGTAYTVVSGGANLGNKSSIVIGGTEESGNTRGLNIAVYDNQLGMCIDSAVFDTFTASERGIQDNNLRLETLLDDGATLPDLSGKDRVLYQYDREYENNYKVKTLRQNLTENDIVTYLTAFWDDEDIDIYLVVQGDAADILTDEARSEIGALGLTELADIGSGDSYLAVISGGEVLSEERKAEGAAMQLKTAKYSLDSGDSASMMVDGKEYASGKSGINVVIYDEITDTVIDSMAFCAVEAE